MALDILYAPQFLDNLEAILTFFDERNGSDSYRVIRGLHSCFRND